MSLKSFLSKIWASIKLLFNGLPSDLKSAIHIGVIITENIKKFVDSPLADILTVLIPGDVDDKIKELLRGKLPIILAELKLTDNCDNLTDSQSITSCAIKTIQSLDGNIQSAFLHSISVLVAQVASDGKLTWSDGVYLLEWYYQYNYKVSAE